MIESVSRAAGWRRLRMAAPMAVLLLLAPAPRDGYGQVGQAPPHPQQEGTVEAPEGAGQEGGEGELPGRPISLAAAVQRAAIDNPLTRAGRLDVRRRQLDAQQLESTWYLSQMGANAWGGIVPAARGNIFYSPDTANDINDLGPFYRFEVTAVMPVYTFGRVSHASAAARSLVNAEQGRADGTRDQLTRQVVDAYWGLVAALESLEVTDEMSSTFDELLDKVDEKLQDNSIDPNDAYQVRAGRFDVRRARLDAVENHAVLQGALAELMGESPGTTYRPEDERAPTVELTREDLPRLQQLARRMHPEVRALDAAVAALDESMKLARANRWPLFVVGGQFSMAQSPNRDDQDNPFVYDEFNFIRLGAAFNIRWDLNFARHNLDFTKRKVERDAAAARADALAMRVAIDVQRALERVLKNVQLVEEAEQTRRTTRRWLRTAFDDFDLGIGEAQPLIRAYQADYRLQGLIIETQYELNLSLAELALVLGDFHTYVRWIADGRVALD